MTSLFFDYALPQEGVNKNMEKKLAVFFVLVGIGIGIVIASIINIINPTLVYSEYTESQVKQMAREIGMVDMKEGIQKSMENEPDSSVLPKPEVNINEDNEDNNGMIRFEIKRGETSEINIDNLYELELISDKEEFEKLVFENEVSKRFKFGIYEIEKNAEYEKIIRTLTE